MRTQSDQSSLGQISPVRRPILRSGPSRSNTVSWQRHCSGGIHDEWCWSFDVDSQIDYPSSILSDFRCSHQSSLVNYLRFQNIKSAYWCWLECDPSFWSELISSHTGSGIVSLRPIVQHYVTTFQFGAYRRYLDRLINSCKMQSGADHHNEVIK